MMMPHGSGMRGGWGPRPRISGPGRVILRNARASRTQRRLKEKCNDLTTQLAIAQSQIEQIESKNDEKRRKIDEYETHLSRLQSEILRAHNDAQRNRQLATEKEHRAAERARIGMAERIMSVADDFANALEVAQEQKMDPKWFDGFKAMADKVENCLVSAGYQRFESLGEDMDPSRHEALATMPTSDDQDGKVIQVIEAGYEDTKTSQVVRVAKVLVGRSTGDASTD